MQPLLTVHSSPPTFYNNHPVVSKSEQHNKTHLHSTKFFLLTLHPCSFMTIMSTASDMGPDKQTLVQFHRYVDLPAELRIKVIQEFIMDLREEHRFRYQLGRPQFARFAVIHSEWQHEFEAEQELFGGLCLSTDDLPAYRAILNQHRRDSLSKLTLRVYIDNTAVGFNRQIDHRSGRAGVVSRAGALIVNSMATILESVEDSIQNGSQAARAGLEIQTQIMIPGFGVDGDDDHRRLRGILSSNRGIDCDFSQLPVLHTARKFSQPILTHSQVLAMGHPMLLFLNPLSLLSLVRRMPNLEQATAGIAPGASLTLGHISGKFKPTGPRCSGQLYGSISQSHQPLKGDFDANH